MSKFSTTLVFLFVGNLLNTRESINLLFLAELDFTFIFAVPNILISSSVISSPLAILPEIVFIKSITSLSVNSFNPTNLANWSNHCLIIFLAGWLRLEKFSAKYPTSSASFSSSHNSL